MASPDYAAAVRILLPPSEGKAAPAQGPALDLAALSLPVLDPVRHRVLNALVSLCAADPDAAAGVLRLGPTQLGEVARNAGLATAPCAPAMHVYTGVLFAALDLPTLPPADADRVLIASALFGLLSPADPIPAYKLPGTVRLPGLPSPGGLWGAALAQALAEAGPVVDLRSGTYARWCRPRGAVQISVVTLRAGRKVAVSHFNKATKGRVARDLLVCDGDPSSTSELHEVLRNAGWEASIAGPHILEVLLRDPVA